MFIFSRCKVPHPCSHIHWEKWLWCGSECNAGPAFSFFLFFFLALCVCMCVRQGVSMYLRLASNLQASFLSLLSAGITEIRNHTQLQTQLYPPSGLNKTQLCIMANSGNWLYSRPLSCTAFMNLCSARWLNCLLTGGNRYFLLYLHYIKK
jgi:hypothetical protein